MAATKTVEEIRKLRARQFEGLNVIGGANPTGKFPSYIGEGIFGLPKQNDGIFSDGGKPLDADGIFFTPYSMSSYEMACPETEWCLERRPGKPLYPGSSSRGIVLVGPSMGQEDTRHEYDWKNIGLVAAGVAALWLLIKK